MRYGMFKIPNYMIDNYPDLVKRIMGECIIVRAESLYVSNVIEYYAISDWFDEVPEGYLANEYIANIIKEPGKPTEWQFIKRDDCE